MSYNLPPRANLEHLKNQARELLDGFRDRQPDAIERFRSSGPPRRPDKPQLADAQRVIAREYGFSSWMALREHVEKSRHEPDPRAALFAAVRDNQVDRARELLENHPALRSRINDPVPELPFGGRPLGAVVECKNPAMIDLFLAHGADINARSDWWAGSFGVLDGCDPDLAPFLISRGATVDAHAAARLGFLDKLRELVTADPGVVHSRGGDGQTPLHFASSIPIAEYLLDHGAVINALDVDHEGTPAQWMISDRTEIARFLVGRGAGTDILLAAALGDLALVRRFLDDDAASIATTASPRYYPMRDPQAGGHIYLWSLGRHKSVFAIARDFGHHDIWQLLMDRSTHAVRVAEACRLGDEALLRDVLSRDPDALRDLPDEIRRRLVDAAQDENVAAVRLMLAAGWPTDGRGQENATALHWAAFLGNSEIVRELLQRGAAIDVKGDDHDGTPLSWGIYGSVHSWTCRKGDYAGTVRALLDAGALPPSVVEEASDAVREELARRF